MDAAGPHMLRASDYPFTIDLYDVETGERVWGRFVTRPARGRLEHIHIPGFGPRRIMVVTRLATGHTSYTLPDGDEHLFWTPGP